MWLTQNERDVKKTWLLFFIVLFTVVPFGVAGRSTADYLAEDEWFIVVVISRVRCLFVCCWLGCRSCGDGGREVVLGA